MLTLDVLFSPRKPNSAELRHPFVTALAGRGNVQTYALTWVSKDLSGPLKDARLKLARHDKSDVLEYGGASVRHAEWDVMSDKWQGRALVFARYYMHARSQYFNSADEDGIPSIFQKLENKLHFTMMFVSCKLL